MSYNLVNPTTGDLTRVAGGTLYADNPIGSIIPFGSLTIPAGYLLCNGQAVSRTTYSELFAAIGTAFGAGDGSNTFNVPDMREVVPVGVGQNGTQSIETHDVYTLAQFKDDQLQDHRHANTPYVNVANGSYSTAYSNDAPVGYGQSVATGRYGTTTHGKQMGVNYIIKAKHVGIPSDFIDAVDDAIADTTVDTVTDGNMSPVTSNAVYDALAPVDISNSVTVGSGIVIRNGTLHVVRSGHTVNVSFIIDNVTDTTSVYLDILTGLPTPKATQEISSICFTNSTMYYCGYYFDGTLRMYERTDGFSRVQFTYVCI